MDLARAGQWVQRRVGAYREAVAELERSADGDGTTFEDLGGEAFDELSQEERTALIEQLAERRERVMADYRNAAEHLRLRARQGDDEMQRYHAAVQHLDGHELTHQQLVSIGSWWREPIVHGDSFWYSILNRRRKKQLGSVPEKFFTRTKEHDIRFAEEVGVRTPRNLYSGRFAEVPADVRTSTIIKPVVGSGSKGCFYLFGEDAYFSVRTSTPFRGWDELGRRLAAELRVEDASDVEVDVQELVMEPGGQPARDLKFYTFYGEIGLIQEVLRHPVRQYEFFDTKFRIAPCGRDRTYETPFLDQGDTVVDRGALDEARLETVRQMSLAIPAPFMRLDFLHGEDELVFIEFSAAPGLAHSMSPQYDQLLGKMWNAAEVRLTNDLLDGKQFEEYRQYLVDVT